MVKKIELRSDDLKEPLSLDLTLPADELKKQSFTIKEGADYQLHFFFKVNNEILSGLRYSMVSFDLVPKNSKIFQTGGETQGRHG